MKTVTLTIEVSVSVPYDTNIHELTVEMENEDFSISHRVEEVKYEVEGYRVTKRYG